MRPAGGGGESASMMTMDDPQMGPELLQVIV
jgi:hypothetical protein